MQVRLSATRRRNRKFNSGGRWPEKRDNSTPPETPSAPMCARPWHSSSSIYIADAIKKPRESKLDTYRVRTFMRRGTRMAFPEPGRLIYGVWTQISDANADLESRLSTRGLSALDAPCNAAGNGVADDLAKLDTLINISTPPGGTCVIPGGRTYLIGGTLSVRRSDITIIMTGATLKHVGAGVAFTADGSGIANGLANVAIIGGLVDGNSKTTVAWRFLFCARSSFLAQRARNCTSRAFSVEFCVSCEFHNPRCTTNDAGMAVKPSTGFYIGSRNPNEHSTNCTIVNPIFEGLTGASGLEFQEATGNTVYGGTSEANSIGIKQHSGASANLFIGFFCEQNTASDIDDSGFFNIYDNCHANSAHGSKFRTSSYKCTIRGGYFPTGIIIEQNCRGTLLDGIAYAGIIADKGTNTQRRSVWHIPEARYDADVVNVRS